MVGGFGSPGIRLRRTAFGWADLPAMSGREVLLTGATSGLGRAAAEAMVGLGAQLTIVGRDRDRTQAAAQALTKGGGPEAHPVAVAIADMGDLAAVRRMLAEYRAGHDRLDVLVHNAGAMADSHTLTAEGFEATYASQVLGPHVLTCGLLDLLRAGEDPRVVTVSSGGMYAEKLDPTHMQMQAAGYDGVRAYARAKRAQVAMTQQWAARFPLPVGFHSMHPGWADTPGVQESLPTFRRVTGPLLRTPAEGADTIVWLSAVRPIPAPSGTFWLDRRPRGTVRVPGTGASPQAGSGTLGPGLRPVGGQPPACLTREGSTCGAARG